MANELANNLKPDDPDRELVQRARQGEFAAFEQLVGKYERLLYTLAMRILHNRADAEEVVQETFMAAVEHLEEFVGRSTFYTWLVRICTNGALKVLRKRKGLKMTSLAAQSAEDDSPLPHPEFVAEWQEKPENILERREIQQLLGEALDQLEEKYRLVFLLRDVQGLSTEETAEALEISVANVKVRLLRARLMLRELLTRHFGNEARRVVLPRE